MLSLVLEIIRLQQVTLASLYILCLFLYFFLQGLYKLPEIEETLALASPTPLLLRWVLSPRKERETQAW